MSKAKCTREFIDQQLTLFVRAAEKEHKSNDYACGVLTTLLTNAMVDMPLHKQKEIMSVLNTLVDRRIEI